MKENGKKTSFAKFLAISALSVVTAGCSGGGSDCSLLSFVDPSGTWRGILARTESDCPDSLSRGSGIGAIHDVSQECVGDGSDDSSEIFLSDETGRFYDQSSVSFLAGGSFTVEYEAADDSEKSEISYDNFDGELADAEIKIRRYANDRIVCSERYQGQVRKD